MAELGARLLRGAVAGAVGTVALNATTYADMAVRRRPGSSTPEQTVEELATRVHAPLPKDDESRQAVLHGLGPLLGIAAGVSAGAVLGLLRPRRSPGGLPATTGTAWALGMLVGNAPMTLLGVTDPRTWSATDWAADVVPHLAYAAAAAATIHAFDAG